MSAQWTDRLPADPIPWLLASDELWTRYRTLVDLLDPPEASPERSQRMDTEVQRAPGEMLVHFAPRAWTAESAIGTKDTK